MVSYFRKVFYLLDVKKKEIFKILFIVISASLSEAFGIRLIYPFILSNGSQELSLESIFYKTVSKLLIINAL